MKKLFSIFLFTSLFFMLPITQAYILVEPRAAFNPNNYQITDTEIVRDYLDPMSQNQHDDNQQLMDWSRYVISFEIAIDDDDKLIMNRGLMKAKIEFDFQENVQSLGHKTISDTHIVQYLDNESFRKEYKTNYYDAWFDIPNNPPNPIKDMHTILKFDFTSNGNITFKTSRHDLGPGMESWLKVEDRLTTVSNIKLKFDKPAIFNTIKQKSLNLPYFTNSNDINSIDQKLVNLFNQDSQAIEYFELVSLTDEQKKQLLVINKNYTTQLQIPIRLKNKYNVPLFVWMIKDVYIKINFAQQINLSELSLLPTLTIETGQDPIKQYLQANQIYNEILLNKCTLKFDENMKQIVVTGDNKTTFNSLNVKITIKPKPIIKKNLQNLKLNNDLGTINVDKELWHFESSFYFDSWINQNKKILLDEKIVDYIVEDFQNGEIVLSATKNNKYFEGYVILTLKVLTPNDRKIDLRSLNLQTDLGNFVIEKELDNPNNFIYDQFVSANQKVKDLLLDDLTIKYDNQSTILTVKDSCQKYKGKLLIQLTFELKEPEIEPSIDIASLNLINQITSQDIEPTSKPFTTDQLIPIWLSLNKNKLQLSPEDFDIQINENLMIIKINSKNLKYFGTVNVSIPVYENINNENTNENTKLRVC